jgi:hypothetical protein
VYERFGSGKGEHELEKELEARLTGVVDAMRVDAHQQRGIKYLYTSVR